ncbi:YggT family protein [Austwickia chelonae]|uniref:YggT family protein n=1 Tax=Austwickia chelonae TaxID=100225 RepID=UPI000E2359C6|nr:YggT family protein [Austwickia chelonae]
MNVVRLLLIWILNVFLLLLLARLALDWIQMFARDWRPRGVLLVIAEGLYTVTDPPLRAVRKVVPPLNLGGVALDLSFMVVVLIIWLLRVLLLR